MVGKDEGSMKEQKETFAQITAEFIGKPYSESGLGPDAYGCLGFCYSFLKRAGKAIVESEWEYDGLTLANYMESWKENHAALEAKMVEAFKRIGAEVPVSRKIAGDLLILKTQNGSMSPAIYAGNGNFMASFADGGVKAFAIDRGLTVVIARRL